MARPKLFEVLGLPRQKSMDITVHKLRSMAKERGIPRSQTARKEELYEMLGIERSEVNDLRAVRGETIRGPNQSCEITLISVPDGRFPIAKMRS